MAISETHERDDKASKSNKIPGYESWDVMRSGSDKKGGGLSIIYRDNLKVHWWYPSVSSDKLYVRNERQWLLISGGCKKLAFLHVYIACQSNTSDSFLEWNEDLFALLTEETLVLKAQGFSILALGDFNTRVGQLPGLKTNLSDTNKNFPMFINFIKSTSLVIINTLPVSRVC